MVIVPNDDGRTLTSKQLTTDDDLTRCCIQGVEDVIGRWPEFSKEIVGRTIHATTQATNAILAERTPPVAFLGTLGFEQMFTFQRLGEGRIEHFDLLWDAETSPVHSRLTYGVPERILADGSVARPVDQTAVRRIAKELADKGVASVAICLLHAYRQPKHEQEVEAIVRQARLERMWSAPPRSGLSRVNTTAVWCRC